MEPGDVVADRYVIERQAGAGAMGVVYLAQDRSSGEPVALKVLRLQGEADAGRFLREAELLAELDHPGIVRHLAHGRTAAGVLYLVLEWLDGETLSDRLDRQALTVADSVALCLRVAEALRVAHQRGIVHRDLKPSNLFLVHGALERVKVLDFGIARLADASLRLTMTGAMVGTPGYMAPEQARGDRQIDARADVYALGCLLFLCLTGRKAFEGDGVLAVLVKVLLGEAPRVREVRGDISPALDALVARMTSKDPGQRPNDAAAVAFELAAFVDLEGSPPSVHEAATPSLTAEERRAMTVVLARRSTPEGPPSSRRPGEDTFSQYPAQGDVLRRTARRHGGALEVLADGSLVITFTSSGTATDHAASAVRCALAMQRVIGDGAMAVVSGSGVVSGRTPMGDVIDRGATLVTEQSPGIRVDEVTAGLLDAQFEVEASAGGLVLRGRREDAEGGRTLLGKRTPCVGRERELRTLEYLFEECTTEPIARAALLTGSAGVGKSRLRDELVQRVRARGDEIEIWMARGDPMRASASFGLLGDILRRTAGLLDGEPLEARQQKLAARVAQHVEASQRGRVTAFLGEMVGAPRSAGDRVSANPGDGSRESPPGSPMPGSPMGERESGLPHDHDYKDSVKLRAARQDLMLLGDQMRQAWVDFLEAECRAHPVLLVLEDLQWGDLPTLGCIDAALRLLRDQPFMVLAVGRPEVHELFPGLLGDRGVMELRVGELSPKACEKLVTRVFGDRIARDEITRMVERSAGNPFYLEELMRAVAEGRGDDAPATVLAMVQSRIERLDPEVRRLLRAASVFGQVFWRGGVRALLGGEGAPLAESLPKLVDQEIITRASAGRFPAEEEHTFRNALVREAAYGMLTDADRALGHKLAGEWLERTGEIEAMVLAEHFERGGEPERARGFYLRAAEQALGGNDLAAVIARAERAVTHGAEGEELGTLRLLQAEAHRWRGEHAEAQARAIEAMQWLPKWCARWYSAAGEVALGSGRLGTYEPLIERVDDLCEPMVEISRSYIVGLVRAAVTLLFGGRSEAAARIIARIDEAEPLVAADDPGVMAVIHRMRANRAVSRGDPAEYLLGLESAIACFERAGDARNACNALANAGHASMELGAYAEAERMLRDAMTTAARLGLSTVAAAARHNLGLAQMRQGAVEAGLVTESEAVEALCAQGERRLEAASRMYLAMILARAGRLDEAEQEAGRAVELTESIYGLRAGALAVLGSVRLERGEAAGALAAAAEAMAILERLGGLEEGESLSRLIHAEALHATGDVAAARAAITAARERLLERAERISDRDRRASFLERVPENARILGLAGEWLDAPVIR